MKSSRLLVFVLLFSVGMALPMAQESIRLQFEVVKNGSTVATPEVTVTPGSAGSIDVASVGTFRFTPTFRGSDVAIDFDIASGGKRLQPRLVIGQDEPGSLSWTSVTRAESFKVTVSWIR
jgi:hypothetical protein